MLEKETGSNAREREREREMSIAFSFQKLNPMCVHSRDRWTSEIPLASIRFIYEDGLALKTRCQFVGSDSFLNGSS